MCTWSTTASGSSTAPETVVLLVAASASPPPGLLQQHNIYRSHKGKFQVRQRRWLPLLNAKAEHLSFPVKKKTKNMTGRGTCGRKLAGSVDAEKVTSRTTLPSKAIHSVGSRAHAVRALVATPKGTTRTQATTCAPSRFFVYLRYYAFFSLSPPSHASVGKKMTLGGGVGPTAPTGCKVQLATEKAGGSPLLFSSPRSRNLLPPPFLTVAGRCRAGRSVFLFPLRENYRATPPIRNQLARNEKDAANLTDSDQITNFRRWCRRAALPRPIFSGMEFPALIWTGHGSHQIFGRPGLPR
jgi:hypothetical protein